MKHKYYRKLSVLLIFLAAINACKKNETPEPPPPPHPVPYWIGYKDIVKETDIGYYDVKATPDSLFHVSMFGWVASYKVEKIEGYILLTQKGYYEHKQYGTSMQQMAGGKDGELYLRVSYWGTNTDGLLRLEKGYTTVADIKYNVPLSVRAFNTLCTDKNGVLYVGVTADNRDGGRSCYVAYSRNKGTTFETLLIPGYDDNAIEKVVVDNAGHIFVEMYYGNILYYDQLSKTWKIVFQKDSMEDIRDFTSGEDGEIYVATSGGLYHSANYGGTITKVPLPGDVRVPVIRRVHINAKGTLYITVDAYFVDRPNLDVSNCYYSSDKGMSWDHVTARGKGAYEMTIRGFDANGRLISTFSDTTKVQWYINSKYIQLAVTTSPVE